MKILFAALFFCLNIDLFSQAFYKSSSPGSEWTSTDGTHITSSNASVSSGYTESNTSPGASGSSNAVFNNCSPNNASFSLTSPVISSLGKTNLIVSFGERISSSFPAVTLEWFDGAVWSVLSSNVVPGSSGTWSAISPIALPAGANNNPSLQFRFSYTTSTATNCTVPPNFRVDDFWVGANNKLPIQLAYFDVKLQDKKPLISWTTYSETNNDHYIIQRSQDGLIYSDLAVYKGMGQGTSDHELSYSHIDPNPASGINFYRLKQVDLDGSSSIFPSRSVLIPTSEVRAYPTLFSDHLMVDLPLKSASWEWKVFDLTGHELESGKLSSIGKLQIISFNRLADGMYLLKIKSDMEDKTVKIIKRSF